MKKLNNSLQIYPWGSKTALTKLFQIKNPKRLSIAELWIGAYHKNSSTIYHNNKIQSLREIIHSNPSKILGNLVAKHFGELPFLFKVLCVEKPLSVQVHPNKTIAEKGFIRENLNLIPQNSYKRNYHDNNHKPELVYSLTSFQAMNGFKDFSQIVSLLEPISYIHPNISFFQKQPNQKNLLNLFYVLLNLKGQSKISTLNLLKSKINHLDGETWNTIKNIAHYYPNDNALFFPIFLNIINLKPNEAMFVFPGTPHSYLKGVALEVMANSDNVLRAGLTSKYINVLEFLTNLTFTDQSIQNILMRSFQVQNEICFPITVKDFDFKIHLLSKKPQLIIQKSISLLFCIKGEALIAKKCKYLKLKAGESCFISADEVYFYISGIGKLARIFNDINKL
ncbi:MAG: mannose-6-phosphate isomerase, class I [Pantoea sp. Brub]|nr:mannose-6-phosphate isomerase, class I [Pantoea sp. Brub]